MTINTQYKQLRSAFIDGNDGALTELYRQNHGPLLWALTKKLPGLAEQDVEAILIQAWIVLLAARKTIVGPFR